MVDYRSLVEQADLYYCGLPKEPYQGMPMGNGVTGSMVWTLTNGMGMQINRVDVFSTNSATTAADWDMNSPDYLGALEYCGGLAGVSIDLGENVFDSLTQQVLNMYDGTLHIQGAQLQGDLMVWSKEDAFLWKITDQRRRKEEISIRLSMLRPAVVVRKSHKAESGVGAEGDFIYLTQEFSEKCNTGISENDHYCASCVAAGVVGGKVLEVLEEESGIRIRIQPESDEYGIILTSGASFDSLAEAKQRAMTIAVKAASLTWEEVRKIHTEWWHEYWQKSYMHSPDMPEFSKAWYTYLYYIGSTMRGEYPAKFNGLLFSTGGDARAWGGQYWWYNQSRSHYGLAAANHGDCNLPLFDMLLRNLPKYQKACEQQFGGKGGIYLPETDGFSGPEVLPGEIAEELKAVLLYDQPATKSLLSFMADRSGLNSRWALFYSGEEQKKEDVQTFRWHSNLSYDGGDAGNSMLEYYLYTCEEEFLKRIYPWLKGVAEFYRFHPCGEMEKDGYYHIHHLGWAESITHAKDVIDDITIMKGIYPTVIEISKRLGVDEELRKEWENFFPLVPPYPTSEMEDAIACKRSADGLPTFAIGREPCNLMAEGNPNDCRLRMLFSYDLLNLESKEMRQEEWEIANRSLDSLPVIRLLKQGVPALNGEQFGYSFHRVLVKAAMLGRRDLIRECLPVVLRAFHTGVPCPGGQRYFPNRLPLTNGDEGYSIQELGAFSDQLQYALLQSNSKGPGELIHVIYLLPAWPMEWDISFQLRAKGGFLVTVEVKNKQITFLQILSEKGKPCYLHNPWPEEEVLLYEQNGDVKKLYGKTLTFDTLPGEEYVISLKGAEKKEIEVEMSSRISLDLLQVDLELEDELPSLFVGEKTLVRMSDSIGESHLIEENNSMEVIYTSSNPNVIEIDGNLLSGIKTGSALIMAWQGDRIVTSRKINVIYPRVNDDDSSIVYSGGWEYHSLQFDGSFRNDYHLSTEEGAKAEFAFEGCGVELYAPIGPGFGNCLITIDGMEMGEENCSSGEWMSHKQIYSAKLNSGFHTLIIEAVSDAPVGLDYIRVIKSEKF